MNTKKLFSREKGYQAYFYIAPWLLGFTILQLYPFLSSLYYSFTNYNISAAPEWVGIRNYIELFTKDTEFLNSLKVTFLFTLYTVPGKLLLSLAVAVFLNRAVRGINLVRTIYYLPSLFGGSVAIALLWKLMFMDDGVINAILKVFSLPSVQWLGNPSVSLVTISLLEIWQFGSSMVMFLAALKQVPSSVLEAARMDGAGRIKTFFHVTIPHITPIIFFTLIMQTINALQNFTSAFVITKGGPLKSTYVLGLKLYNEGFAFFKMGYASAISWVIFSIIMIITLFLFRTSSAWVFYEDGKDF
jgi:oligogalacturonide transport system permease protein